MYPELHQVYIALGSNVGDRAAHFGLAKEALAAFVSITEQSPIYETKPWGYQDQRDFLNQVVSGETGLTPHDLMQQLKTIEQTLGREKNFTNGPRVIDLDLLFYDHLVVQTPTLTIPHPRMRGRAFVLYPLADLAPDLRHPIFKKTIRELLAETDQHGISTFVNNKTERPG
jgi:2-amino-4-hydroxy-6-hydroxymethyldihydropteridine diphosphokinase